MNLVFMVLARFNKSKRYNNMVRQQAEVTQSTLLASMAAQLSLQAKQRVQLQEQLQTVNQQLAKVHKTLQQKEHIIDSLELDLEHMVDQLTRLGSKNSKKATDFNKSWINRTVPGFHFSATVGSQHGVQPRMV